MREKVKIQYNFHQRTINLESIERAQMKGATIVLGHPVYVQVSDKLGRIYMRMYCVVGGTLTWLVSVAVRYKRQSKQIARDRTQERKGTRTRRWKREEPERQKEREKEGAISALQISRDIYSVDGREKKRDPNARDRLLPLSLSLVFLSLPGRRFL